MKHVNAWSEECFFVECPKCGETEELGSGIIFSGPPEQKECTCGEVFMVHDPDDNLPKEKELRKA